VRIVGLLLAIAAAALALRSALLLAGRGRPRRGPQPPFVIAGPYLRIRNPLFAGVVLGLVGAALWRDSRWLMLAAIGLGWVAHWWVVHVEEPELRRRFGPAYEAYLRHVPRWIPGRAAPPADGAS
jgi:protein-S-isoprenylcysteine O-methyltransferase Ste14